MWKEPEDFSYVAERIYPPRSLCFKQLNRRSVFRLTSLFNPNLTLNVCPRLLRERGEIERLF